MQKIFVYTLIAISVFLGWCSIWQKEPQNSNNSQPQNLQTQVKKNHEITFEDAYKQIVEKWMINFIEKLRAYIITPAKENWSIKIVWQSPMWGWEFTITKEGKYDYNFNTTQNNRFETKIEIKWNLDLKMWEQPTKWSIDISWILKMVNNKFFVRLWKLDINNDSFQAQMMKQQLKLFLDKRILVADLSQTEENLTKIDIDTLEKLIEKAKQTIKKYPLVKVVKETKEGDYKVFELKLDKDNIVKAYDEILGSEEAKKLWITEEDFQEGKKTLEESLSSINEEKYSIVLKVKSLQDIILILNMNDETWKTVFKLSIKDDTTNINIGWSSEYNSWDMNLSIFNNWFNFNFKNKNNYSNDFINISIWKSWEKITWKANYLQNNIEIFNVTLSWSVSKSDNSTSFNVKVDIDAKQFGKYNIEIKENIGKTDKVEVKEPQEYKTMDQIQQEMYQNMQPQKPENIYESWTYEQNNPIGN